MNGAYTWSFFGDRIKPIHDDHLIIAYCGWMTVFTATQSGAMETEFESDGEEARYLALKEAMGYTDIEVNGRYKTGGMEFVEFFANYLGKSVRVAGNTTAELGFGADQECYQLPAIYFLFGQAAAKDIG